MVSTQEEHTVLGKNRMASLTGREEAFIACAISFGRNQEVLFALFLRSRPCSDSLSALPTSV